MSLLSELQSEAEQAAQSITARIGDLEHEIRRKTEERAKLVDELNHARLASSRLEKYPMVHGSSILCPYCWVARGRLAVLARVEGEEERLRCEGCLTELFVVDA